MHIHGQARAAVQALKHWERLISTNPQIHKSANPPCYLHQVGAGAIVLQFSLAFVELGEERSKFSRIFFKFFVVVVEAAGVLRHLLALTVHLRLACLQLSLHLVKLGVVLLHAGSDPGIGDGDGQAEGDGDGDSDGDSDSDIGIDGEGEDHGYSDGDGDGDGG